MQAFTAEKTELLATYGTDANRGLTEAQAQKNKEQYGENALTRRKPDSLLKRLWDAATEPMLLMLIAAGLIALAVNIVRRVTGGEADFLECVGVFVAIALSVVISVVMEGRSAKAFEALSKINADMTVRAVRDGQTVTLQSAHLAVGDVVLLSAGDKVPADGRLLESTALQVDESALTGESFPVKKDSQLVLTDEKTPLAERANMLYSGTFVTEGNGRLLVTAVGDATEFGKIAGELGNAEKSSTPLQEKLARLGKTITVLGVIAAGIVFAAQLIFFALHGGLHLEAVMEAFITSIVLIVAAVPEGLPTIVAVSLSINIIKLSKQNALVKKMIASETIGCISVICSDKTGTLTQNKMTVVKHELSAPKEKFLAGMALCSDAQWDEELGEAVGEPTECALVNDAGKAGLTGLTAEHPRVGEAPFDSGRKMMSVVVETLDGEYEQYTKGAPDVVIGLCTHIYEGDKVVPLTEERRAELVAANKAMADEALRVLALASRTYTEVPADCSPAALEHDLVFCGLSGMIDPVRPEVADAIREAHDAGIRTVMITGDHIDTAVAIAKQLGIVADRSQAITGADLDRMSDEELDAHIEDYGVYARVQPEHKTRIVEAWKSRDQIVAMTGDGVNDAPSIKRADIGVGMGITGTDVTKNVADMVLADDNFATIIGACEEGRRIYDNIRKVIQFLLSANLAEVFSVFIATLIGFTIFQPVQLLWVNLVTDCFPALALGMEDAEGDIMKRKPRNAKDGVFAGHMGLDCVVQGLIITVLVLASFFVGVYFDMGYIHIADMIAGNADEEGVMMAFITLNMVEIFHCFNMRSRRASLFTMKKQNKWLWASAALALVLTVIVTVQPTLAEMFFGPVTLELKGVLAALGLAFLIIPLMEIYKAIMRAVEKE